MSARTFLALAGLIFLAGLAGVASPGVARAQSTERGPLEAIYGAQSLPIDFDHAKHLTKAKMSCDECHDVAKSTRPTDRNLPPESACFDCHDVTEANPEKAEPPSACFTCHPGYSPTFPPDVERDDTAKATPHPPAVEVPTAALVFSHKAHLGRGAKCEACHKGVADARLATLEHMPMMDDCLTCHDGKAASAKCATCHLARPDGVLVTSLPGGKLVPRGLFRNDDHRGDFARSHGPAAKADAAYCKSCHTESECAKCHTGHIKPLTIHAADYILTHPPEARRDDPQCSKCHRLQTFCRDCHLRSGVTTAVNTGFGFRDAENAGGMANFHSPTFKGDVTSPDHHMYEARRNLRQCVGCHQESDCVRCHATLAMGGSSSNSPHPGGFERTCGRILRVNDRPCRQCHSDMAALARECD